MVLPDGLPSSVATALEPLTSVLRSLLVNAPRPGDVCVVLSCGPSALLAVQVLKRYFGADRVIALDRNQERLDIARAFGADLGYNTETQQDETSDLIQAHRDHYADFVFDALPHVPGGAGRDIRELAMGLLRPGGDYVIYGASALPQRIDTWPILAKGLNLRATAFDVRQFPMYKSAHVLTIAAALVESGLIDVRPVFTRQVPLLDEKAVVEAFRSYGTGASMKTSMLGEDTAALTTLIPAQAVGDSTPTLCTAPRDRARIF